MPVFMLSESPEGLNAGQRAQWLRMTEAVESGNEEYSKVISWIEALGASQVDNKRLRGALADLIAYATERCNYACLNQSDCEQPCDAHCDEHIVKARVVLHGLQPRE